MSRNDWISVDERLPEMNKPVLVSCVDGVLEYVWIARWQEDGDSESGWSWTYPETDYSSATVVAWQPLPEVYKKTEEK